ncbi:hypothetical protein HZU73_00319 [Apis mellifera caucasica]|nr:hypothetical protein HZU73_00319 [Apis mellifera caucasica]
MSTSCSHSSFDATQARPFHAFTSDQPPPVYDEAAAAAAAAFQLGGKKKEKKRKRKKKRSVLVTVVVWRIHSTSNRPQYLCPHRTR